jgi:hypothetical protein
MNSMLEQLEAVKDFLRRSIASMAIGVQVPCMKTQKIIDLKEEKADNYPVAFGATGGHTCYMVKLL